MNLFIFALGALGYGYIEILCRGYTHWTMLLTGGACLLTLYYLNQPLQRLPLLVRAVGGALVITFFEFWVGVLVNLWYGWRVWDYSHLPGNLLGQICLRFVVVWFLLCLGLLLLCRAMSRGYRYYQRIRS